MRTAILRLIAAFTVVAISGFSTARAQEQNIYYIVDASGSMWAQMEGSTKMEIAKSVLLDHITKLKGKPKQVGIVAYGHRRKGDCNDIEEIVKLQPVEEVQVAAALSAMTPKGKTPIAQSVEFVTEKLRELEAAAHVVLISDGEESCHANPCEAIRQLSELGIDFTLDVVGFDLTPEQHEQLQCIAHAGRGRYVPAKSASELYEAVERLEEAPPVPKVAQNIQIVLDRSMEMGKEFSGRRKIDVAREGIAEKITAVGAETENLALRLVGGKCGTRDNTQLEVPFAVDNGSAIKSKLDSIEIVGVPTLAAGLLASTKDFDKPDRFADVNNRIIVFTGSKPYCDSREMADVYKALKEKQIRPDVYFIAMKLPPNERNDLRNLAAASGGRIFEVDTQSDFDRVLDHLFEVEPVLSNIRTVITMLNSVVVHLNTAFRSVGNEEYARANEAVRDGRGIIMDTDVPFRDMGSRQDRETFRKLYETARENRQLQSQGLEIIEGLIAARRDANDINAYKQLIGTANQLIGRYNQNIRRLDQLMQPLNDNVVSDVN